MKQYRVLVTGVGAIIGYGIVQSLKKSKYSTYVVGTDIYNDAVGRWWCDSFIQAVPASDKLYMEFMFEVIKKQDIDIVIFGTEQEMHKAAFHFGDKEWGKCKFVLNKHEVIMLSADKWETFRFMKSKNLPVIDSMIDVDFENAKKRWGVPFLLKPRRSYASKGIVTVDNEAAFAFFKQAMGENFMAQELVGDNNHEYTVGIFGYGNGEYEGPIVFERKLSGEGATAKAEVVKLPLLNEQVDLLTKILKPVGPTNYQFRLHKEEYLLLEINPRISSSSSLRTSFGFNEIEMCISYFMEGQMSEGCEIKSGHASRYIADWVIYE